MSSGLSPRAPASPDAINLAVVGRNVARKLPWLAIACVGVGVATAAVLMTMSPKYLSQAQLEVRSAAPGDGGRPDKEAVGTHVRGLMSTALALAMSKALDLTRKPEFNSALPPDDLYGRTLRSVGIGAPKPNETDEDRLMQAYFQNVRAYQVRDTRSIIVDCTTSDAKFSADCANTLAKLYRASLSGRSANENSDLRAKLEPQVARLARETEAAEATAREFPAKANLFQVAGQVGQLKEQQLGELTQELTRISAARSDADARAKAASDMAVRGIAAANPDVQKSAFITQMEEQRVGLERQIAELSATLLPGHPRMKQLRAEIGALRGQINAEVQKVVESLGSDARIAAAREDSLKRRIDEMKRTVVSAVPDTAKLAQLENDARAKRQELERLQGQYEQASTTAGTGTGVVEVEIVSQAYPSNEKVFPKIGAMSSMATFAAFIVGFALLLTRELIRGARPAETGERVQPQLSQSPPLASAPKARRDGTIAGSPRSSRITPASDIDGTVSDLLAASAGVPSFRILLAGDRAGVDGAVEALQLAQAMAEAHRHVVVAAWAGSGDRLAVVAGVRPSPGVADVLSGQSQLKHVVQADEFGAVDIIAAGNGAAGATNAGNATALLDALDGLYDVIVVCAPSDVASMLFEATEGRFDAGVIISDRMAPGVSSGRAAFLGFSVDDFPVHVVAPTAKGGSRRVTAAAPSALRTTARR